MVKEGQVAQADRGDYTLDTDVSRSALKEDVGLRDYSNNEAKADATLAPDGQLILAEDVEDGHVSWNACKCWSNFVLSVY